MDHPGLGLEVDAEVLHRRHQRSGRPFSRDAGRCRRGHRDSVLGSSTSRRPSPTRLKASAQRKIIRPGEGRGPPAPGGDADLALADEDTPLGQTGLGQADEAEGGANEDDRPHVHGRLDHHRGDRVGEDVLEVDPELGVADDPGGVDVLVLLHVDDLSPDDSGVLHPVDDGQGEDDVRERRAEHSGDRQGEDELGYGEEDVHHPHQDLVDLPSDEARQAPDDGADGHGHRRPRSARATGRCGSPR